MIEQIHHNDWLPSDMIYDEHHMLVSLHSSLYRFSHVAKTTKNTRHVSFQNQHRINFKITQIREIFKDRGTKPIGGVFQQATLLCIK